MRSTLLGLGAPSGRGGRRSGVDKGPFVLILSPTGLQGNIVDSVSFVIRIPFVWAG